MMKNHKLFGAIACSVIALTMSSCGKEDKIERFPEGTSMIKMMEKTTEAPHWAIPMSI